MKSLDFDLGEEIDQLREVIQRFASAMVAPHAAQADRDNAFPQALCRQFGELGLLGLTVEEEFGGANPDYLAHVVAMEEISRACPAIGLSYEHEIEAFNCVFHAMAQQNPCVCNSIRPSWKLHRDAGSTTWNASCAAEASAVSGLAINWTSPLVRCRIKHPRIPSHKPGHWACA